MKLKTESESFATERSLVKDTAVKHSKVQLREAITATTNHLVETIIVTVTCFPGSQRLYTSSITWTNIAEVAPPAVSCFLITQLSDQVRSPNCQIIKPGDHCENISSFPVAPRLNDNSCQILLCHSSFPIYR